MLKTTLTAIVLLLLFPVSTSAESGSKTSTTSAADPNAKAIKSTQPLCLPFAGEKMTFAVNWEFINGGTAIMETSAREKGYRIHTFAFTNKFMDVFHKVRDTMIADGFCNKGKMQSEEFTLEQREPKYSATKKTRFLWQQDKVEYTHNKKTEMFDVPAGYVDVLSSFYAVRTMKLEIGKKQQVPVFDQRKNYEVEVITHRKETMRAPWSSKPVEVLVIQPILKTDGVFSSKGEMLIWITNDERHIPLKVSAKVRIGHVLCYLTDYRPPAK